MTELRGVTPRVRKSGVTVYEAQVRLPRLNGKPRSPLSKTFPTPELAQAWHDQQLQCIRAERLNPAPNVPVGPPTLDTWAAMWVPKALHWTPQAKVYAADRLRLHVSPVLGAIPLTDLRPTHISDLLGDLLHRDEKPLAHPSVARIHAILGQVLNAAVAQKLIDSNPAKDVRLPKRTDPQRRIEAWNPTQVEAFLAQPATQASPLFTLFVAAFRLGARRSELLSLTPANVHLGADPHLFIRRSKSERGKRRLPLTPKVVDAMREQRARRAAGPQLAPQLWLQHDGSALSPTQVSKAFQALVDRFVDSPAGQATNARRLTLHGARHSWVTNALAAGMPPDLVSKLAGHASMAFTVDRYGHLLESHDCRVVEFYG